MEKERENKKIQLKIKRENRKNSTKKVKKMGLLNLLMVLFLMMFLFSFVFKNKENIFSIRRQNKIALKAPIVFSTYTKEDFKYEEKEGKIYISSLTEKGKEKLKAGSFNLKVPGKIDEKTVKGIKAHAFQKEKINALAVSDGIEIIEEYAFANNNLTSISLPASLKEIGNYAFRDNKLEKLDLSLNKKLLKINLGAFSNNNLSELKLNSTLNLIGNSAFEQNNLVKVQIPESVKTFGQTVFTKNGRYVKVETKNPLIKSERIKGSFGHIVNPVYIEVKYTGIEDVTKPNEKSELMPSKILGDDLSKENEVFILNEPNTFIPEKIYGYNTKSKLDFTPDKDGFVLEVIYYNIKKEPVIKENNIPNLKLNEKVDKERLLSFVTVEDVAGFKAENINLTVTPETLDTATGGLKKVTYKAENEFGFASTKEVEIPVALNWYEYPIGGGWTLGDFKYAVSPEGENVLVGFSKSGKEKADEGKLETLVLPGVMPDDTSATYNQLKKITQIGILTKDYTNDELIERDAKLNNKSVEELLNELGKSDVRQKINTFINMLENTLSSDYDQIKRSEYGDVIGFESTFKNIDFSNLIELKYIGNFAFSDCRYLEKLNLSNLTKLEKICDMAFIELNGEIKEISFENCNNLKIIDKYNFIYFSPRDSTEKLMSNLAAQKNGENQHYSPTKIIFKNCMNLEEINGSFIGLYVEEVNLNNLTKLKKIGDFTFSGNASSRVKLNNCKELIEIGEGAFSGNMILENLDLSNLKKLKIVKSSAFMGHFARYYVEIREYYSRNIKAPEKIDLSGCENLERIGADAFSFLGTNEIDLSNCSKLRIIEEDAFQISCKYNINFDGCINLEKIGEKQKYQKNGSGFNGAFSSLFYLESYVEGFIYGLIEDKIDEQMNVNFSKLPNLKYINGFNGIKKKNIDFSKNTKIELINGFNSIWGGYYNEYPQGKKYLIHEINIDGLKNLKSITGFNSQNFEKINFSTNINLEYIGDPDFIKDYQYKNLTFYNNNIQKIDLSKNVKLKEINGFDENKLDEVNFETLNKLEKINGLSKNNLKEVDFSKNINLKEIEGFNSNQINQLNLHNLNKLENIDGFSYNNIENLDFSDTINLKSIEGFENNKIEKLDFSQLSKLEKIHGFSENNIKKDIKINDNLKQIGIYYGTFRNNPVNPVILRTESGNNPNNIRRGSYFIVDPIDLKIYLKDESGNIIHDVIKEYTDGGTKTINLPYISGYNPKDGYIQNIDLSTITDEEYKKGYKEVDIIYLKEKETIDPNIGLKLDYSNPNSYMGDTIRANIRLEINEASNIKNGIIRFGLEGNYIDPASIKIPGSELIKSNEYKNGKVEIVLNEVQAGTSAVIPVLFKTQNGITPDGVKLKSYVDIINEEKNIIAKAEDNNLKNIYPLRSLYNLNKIISVDGKEIVENKNVVNENKVINLISGVSHTASIYNRNIEKLNATLEIEDLKYLDKDGTEISKKAFLDKNINRDLWEEIAPGKFEIKNVDKLPEFNINIDGMELPQSIKYNIKVELNQANKHKDEMPINLSGNGVYSISPKIIYPATNYIYKYGTSKEISEYEKNKDLYYTTKLKIADETQKDNIFKVVETNLDKRLKFEDIYIENVSNKGDRYTDDESQIKLKAKIYEYKNKKGSNEGELLSSIEIELSRGISYQFKNPNDIDYYVIEIDRENNDTYITYNTNVKVKDEEKLFANINKTKDFDITFRGDVRFEDIETSSRDKINGYGDISIYKRTFVEKPKLIEKRAKVFLESTYKNNNHDNDYVLAGEKGSYTLETSIVKEENEAIKDFKAVFELPEGIDIDDISVNKEFLSGKEAKYEVIERYNGKENAAIVFTAKEVYSLSGNLAYIQTSTNNMMDDKIYTATFTLDFSNEDIKKETMIDSKTFKLAAVQEVAVAKSIKILKNDSFYTRRKVEFNNSDKLSYQLSVKNKTVEPRTELYVVDILPYMGDNAKVNLTDISENESKITLTDDSLRGTNLNVKFLGNIKINGKDINNTNYGVKYSVSDPKTNQIIWQDSLPNNIEDVKAVKIYLKSGVFNVNERIDITFDIKPDLKENMTVEEMVEAAGKQFSNNLLRKDNLTKGRYLSSNTVEAVNEGPKGTIKFIKKGYKKSFWNSLFNKEEKLNAKPLKGVTFSLKNMDGKYVMSATSNNNGEVIFKDVKIGSYKIVEESAPAGYSLSTDEIIVAQEDFKIINNQIVVNLKDEIYNAYPLYGNLKIIKKDVKGNPLKGIEFEVVGTDSHNKDQKLRVKTDAKGEAYLYKLKDGNYQIIEKDNIKKGETGLYLRNPISVSIQVDKKNIETNGTYGTVEKEIVNDKAKIAMNTIAFEELVANVKEAKYKHISEISNFNKEKLNTDILDFYEIIEENGKTNYNNLGYGIQRSNGNAEYGYIVLETDKKYRVKNDDSNRNPLYKGVEKFYDFYVTPDGKLKDLNGNYFKENRINFPIQPKDVTGEVIIYTPEFGKITKDDRGNDKRSITMIKDVEITLYKKVGLKEKEISKKLTDEQGKVYFNNLDEGTYIARNTNTPNGYSMNKNEFKFTISKLTNPREHIWNKDYFFSNFTELEKVNNYKNYKEELNNGIYYEGENILSQNYHAYAADFEAKKLDINLVKGEMVLSNIPKEDAENKLKELEGTRAIEKGGFVDIVKPLNDVKFDLYENDKLIGERRSDEKGNINLDKGLSDKNTYTIVEKQAADGYMLDKNPVSIDINSLKKIEGFTGKIDRFIENKPYEGSLTVSKYDRKTKKVLEGIEFTLYKEEDGNLKEFKKGVTNNIGLIEFKTLPIGKYEVKETKTIDGYIKEDFTQKFEVTKDNTKFNYVFYNEQVSHDLYINVVDKAIYDVEKPNSLQDPKAYIKDAEFVLSSEGKYLKVIEQDEKTNVIKKYEWVDKKDRSILKTNEKGEIIIEKLYRGNYILEEVKAAEFYKLPLINSRDITIKDKNVDVLIINERKVKMPVSGVDKLMRSSLLGLTLTFTGRLLIRRKKKEDLKKRTIRK